MPHTNGAHAPVYRSIFGLVPTHVWFWSVNRSVSWIFGAIMIASSVSLEHSRAVALLMDMICIIKLPHSPPRLGQTPNRIPLHHIYRCVCVCRSRSVPWRFWCRNQIDSCLARPPEMVTTGSWRARTYIWGVYLCMMRERAVVEGWEGSQADDNHSFRTACGGCWH